MKVKMMIVITEILEAMIFRNVACNRGRDNVIDTEGLNVHIDYKKVSGEIHSIYFDVKQYYLSRTLPHSPAENLSEWRTPMPPTSSRWRRGMTWWKKRSSRDRTLRPRSSGILTRRT